MQSNKFKAKIETPCLIYARSSSTRLPRKNLMDLGGKPVYKYMFEKLSLIFENVIFLTSNDESDNDFCERLDNEGIEFFRGDLKSPLKRTYDFLINKEYMHFYRVCGDSPLYPIDLVKDIEEEAISINDKFSVVTNVHPTRLWPKGWSIERVPTLLIKKAIEEGLPSEQDQEHLTPWIYSNAKIWN